jgi:cell division initiation protein
VKIAPVDIRNQNFKRVVRGADPEEVRIFLGIVADEMEKLISLNRELQQRVDTLEVQVEEYRKVETTLRDTLLTAERVSSESRENSRKEAELILRDAELRAERILDDTARRASELRREIVELRNQKEVYIARLRSLIETQLKLLRFHSVDTAEQEEMIGKLRETQHSIAFGEEDIEMSATASADVHSEAGEPADETAEKNGAGGEGPEQGATGERAPAEDVPYVEVKTREGE